VRGLAGRARALELSQKTLYGNFADLEGDASKIKREPVQRGFVVDIEPYDFGDATMLHSRAACYVGFFNDAGMVGMTRMT